ncbi:unnamed protein product, partial [Discosporangium mesarthrocarpum]
MVEVSCEDKQRAVLSLCLWERTHDADGTESAAALEGGSWRDEGTGYTPVPVYRFLAVEEQSTDGGQKPLTALVSYPRSGNSLLRRLLEEATGVVTGSDTRPDRTLSRSLVAYGMQGEGVVDGRVRVVKSHFPERVGYKPFEAGRVILLVRSPFDAIESYFNMTLTNTHNQSLHDSVYEDFSSLWDGMVRNEIQVWEKFNLHWLSCGLPMIVIRYEDLVRHTSEVMGRLLDFLG